MVELISVVSSILGIYGQSCFISEQTYEDRLFQELIRCHQN